jgi:hypothetical protein
VEGSNNSSRGETAVLELPQGVQQRPQVGLELPRQTPPPSVLRSEDDAVRERRQPLVVITEVEPSALPPLVRRGEGGRDVQLRLVRVQLERAAAGPDGVEHPPHLAEEGEGLRLEEMEPQVLMGLNSHVPL